MPPSRSAPGDGSSSATAPRWNKRPPPKPVGAQLVQQARGGRCAPRLDGRRHGLVRGVGIVAEHGGHLLDEEVALRRVNDAIAERGAIPRSCISPSIRSIDSVSFSWRARRDVRGRGAAHDGRTSKRSGRARQRSRIGALLEKPRTYRAGRASSDLPSGCRPPPRREVASRRASRRAAGTPGPSPPVSPARRSAPIAPRMRRVATGPRSTFSRSASRPASIGPGNP